MDQKKNPSTELLHYNSQITISDFLFLEFHLFSTWNNVKKYKMDIEKGKFKIYIFIELSWL